MNPYKYLIWEYSSKQEKWYDATESIDEILSDDNAWLVKFSNTNGYLHVSYRNLRFYQNPQKIDYSVIEYDGIPQYKTKACLLFDDKYKIFFENGYVLVADFNKVKIYKDELKNNPKAKGILNYYKAVVQLTNQSEEDAFMLSQFDSIVNVNHESVLAAYLKGENGKSSCPIKDSLIFPFGTNQSQMKATEMVFDNRISIIEGPPGTGKTQTILNIIANCITQKYKIAVVSNNNSAVDNIYKKLKKDHFDFFCAVLGNKENIDRFFENINTSMPKLSENQAEEEWKIDYYSRYLNLLFEKNNIKNKLIEKKKEMDLEYEHFLNENKNFDFLQFHFKTNQIETKKLMNVIVFLNEYAKEKLSFFKKFQIQRMLKIKKKFFHYSFESQIILLQNQYFLAKIRDIDEKIKTISEELQGKSFEEMVEEYRNLSLLSFKNALYEQFHDKTARVYGKRDYKRSFNEFTEDYPVILSTTYALAQSTREGYLFDYLIVDESSQVNMASAILAMRVAKNIIVVGDLKQLPQIDERNFEDMNAKLLQQYEVDKSYSYYGHSIMSSILSVYKDNVPRVLLKEHYRCHPLIIGFCNQEFYDNQLVIYSKNHENEKPLKLIKLVEGNHARKNPNGEGGQYSEREADEILKLVTNNHLEDLGIITPYRIQVTTIKNKIKVNNVEVSTIHKFQGREKKHIILSTVVNDVNDFVDDPNMINVAVSRAIDSFTLIASDKVVKSERGTLANLVNYIKYHTDFSEISEGTIRSIYDLLYQDYAKELESFRQKHPSKNYDSENITKAMILKILDSNSYHHLKLALHVSLKELIKEQEINMTSDEIKFFRNPRSHADFVIFNKYSRKPVLIIEVDGVSFHEQQKIQVIRDELKDSIIAKARIPFIRLKTNGSNEENRVLTALNEVLS